MLMPSGSEKAEVRVGDFVEAVFIGDKSITRRGVVTEVWNQRTVVVRGKEFESICGNPRIIPVENLIATELELVSSVTKSIPAEREEKWLGKKVSG
jgi:hypothetical protein